MTAIQKSPESPEASVDSSDDGQATTRQGFIEMYREYHNLSTDGPEIFADFLACQMLGHALGWGTRHAIQPDFIHHNMYLVLCGESTDTRKDTSQNLARKVYPEEFSLPEEFSPEKLIQELSETSHRIGWLGEYSAILKQIGRQGYMAHLVELFNTLFGCPLTYSRAIRGGSKKEGQKFTILSCYLSLNATVTPKMLREFLTEELMEGGFLARWLVVRGEPRVRDRGRLKPEVTTLRNALQETLRQVISLMRAPIYFTFTDEALKRFNEIDRLGRTYDSIRPIAARYINYIIPLADILMVSEVTGLSSFSQLSELSGFIELSRMISGAGENREYQENRDNWIILSRKYVDKAWAMIRPQLDFVKTLGDYIDLELHVARLRGFMDGRHEWTSHSVALRRTKLTAPKMQTAVTTLQETGELDVKDEPYYDSRGRLRSRRFYRWAKNRVT